MYFFFLLSDTTYNQRACHIFIFSQQHNYILHIKAWGGIIIEKLHKVLQPTTWLFDLQKGLFPISHSTSHQTQI